MKNKKRNIYLYASLSDIDDGAVYTVTTTDNMESAGWILIETKEVSFDFEDVDYTGLLKQKKLDLALADQERINAEILELTQ